MSRTLDKLERLTKTKANLDRKLDKTNKRIIRAQVRFNCLTGMVSSPSIGSTKKTPHDNSDEAFQQARTVTEIRMLKYFRAVNNGERKHQLNYMKYKAETSDKSWE